MLLRSEVMWYAMYFIYYDSVEEVVSVLILSQPRDASCDAFRDCLAVRIHLGFASHARALSCARVSKYSHWTPRKDVNPSSH